MKKLLLGTIILLSAQIAYTLQFPDFETDDRVYISSEWKTDLLFFNFDNSDFLTNNSWTESLNITEENLNFGLSYRGNWINGSYEAPVLESILSAEERIFSTDFIIHSFCFFLISPHINLSGGFSGGTPEGTLEIISPELLGVTVKGTAARSLLSSQQIGLIKDYATGFSFLEDNIGASINWSRDGSSVYGGFYYKVPSILNHPQNKSQLRLDISGNSVFDAEIGANFKISDDSFISAEAKHTQYKIYPTAGTDTLRVLEGLNEESYDGYLKINFQNISLSLQMKDFTTELFYSRAAMPKLSGNKIWFESTPLSPAGLLYRRVDILDEAGAYASLLGINIGSNIPMDNLVFCWSMEAGWLHWDLLSEWLYADGTAVLPLMTWNMTEHERVAISESGNFIHCNPRLGICLELTPFSLNLSVNQLIPLFFDSKNIDISVNNQRLWGGTSFSVLLVLTLK